MFQNIFSPLQHVSIKRLALTTAIKKILKERTGDAPFRSLTRRIAEPFNYNCVKYEHIIKMTRVRNNWQFYLQIV